MGETLRTLKFIDFKIKKFFFKSASTGPRSGFKVAFFPAKGREYDRFSE